MPIQKGFEFPSSMKIEVNLANDPKALGMLIKLPIEDSRGYLFLTCEHSE